VGKDGGKAKPLKQAKKGPKEYDEVSCGRGAARHSPAPSGGPFPSEALHCALFPPRSPVSLQPPSLSDALCSTWR
jgi:hypothetical protein